MNAGGFQDEPNHSLAVQYLTNLRMGAGVWNTSRHKHEIYLFSEEEAPHESVRHYILQYLVNVATRY